VRLILAGHPGADTAELCVTELIANAIAYTRSGQEGGTVTVTVMVTPAAAVVIVADQGSPEEPLLTGAAASDEHGRGLVLVDALTSDWGTAPAGDGGREVWFRMAGGQR
jgi:anti-sigma regulatory factor (Ser/Thr protein kinase)